MPEGDVQTGGVNFKLRAKAGPLRRGVSGDRLQPAEANRQEAVNSCPTVAILVDDCQPLHLFRTDGHHQASAWIELVQQASRHLVGCSRHQDLVEGSVLAPAAGSVSLPDFNTGLAELTEEFACNAGELLDYLDAPESTGHLSEDRGLLPQPSPHLQHPLAWLGD